MPSINDISIAINSLFLDITDSLTLGLNKARFFNEFKNTSFRFKNHNDFEFNANPVFRFDDAKSANNFLKREQDFANLYQDYSNKSDIDELIAECNDSCNIDDLFLNYSIEIFDNEIHIYFNTNSLIFKYEVLG